MFRNQRLVGGSWLVVGLAALALSALPVRAEPAAAAAGKVRKSAGTFHSGGKPITVCHFEPAVAGSYPAVVLLHGVDGPKANEALYHRAARRFAARGYQVLFVHYFDRTAGAGEDGADLVGQLQRCRDGTATPEEAAASRARFRAWAETIRDAVEYARALPGVDRQRIGLVGFSLGAYLALSVAADEALRITAVVEFFGGLPREARASLKRLPPVLGFHGDQDRTVPVREAEGLRELLAARRLSGEVQVYQGVGHVFRTDGRLQLGAVVDAERRTAAFLAKHLQRSAGPAK
jgi:dienelactone hydrolase